MPRKTKEKRSSTILNLRKYLLSVDFVVPFLLFIGVFLVYLHNLSPSIFGYDSGDFATAIITKGVPHPSGYPLYTMLGILFNLLPFQTVAWKIGLVSVFSSAFAVLFSYFIILELIRNKTAAVFGALSIAFFYPFWLYAEVVEVLSLNSFFVVLLIFLAIKFHKTKKIIFAYLLSFSAGLSLTNNEVIILLFPALGIVFFSNWKQILKLKAILLCILFFILGLLPYIYIPIAASFHPIINTGDGSNLKNFLNIILRRAYGWGIVSKTPQSFNYNIFNFYFLSIVKETGIFFLVLSFFGAIYLIIKKNFVILGILVIGIILTGPFFFLYSRTPLADYFQLGIFERFIISSYILFGILFYIGVYFIAYSTDKLVYLLLHRINPENSKIPLITIVLLIFCLYPFHLFSTHFVSTDLHNTFIGDNLAKDILNPLPKNSIIIQIHDTSVYNTRYSQIAYDTRTDILAPISYKDYLSYAEDNGLISFQNLLINKDRELKHKSTATIVLMGLNSIKQKTPVFFLYPPDFDKNKYNDIKFIPYGLLQKLANDKDLGLTKEEFIKQQENILNKTQAQDFIKDRSLVLTNYNFISISSIYFAAYLNTSKYLFVHYHDTKAANIYLDKAQRLDPLGNSNYHLQ